MEYRFRGIALVFLFTISVSARIRYDCDNEAVECGCGYIDVEMNAQIVSGAEAIPYSWSMIVSIQDKLLKMHFCDGSILSESYILTAAHCVDNKTPEGILILAGIHNKSDKNVLVHKVDQIYIHPNWSSLSSKRRHDIAILHLSQPLNFTTNSRIKRTCVPDLKWSTSIEEYPLNGTHLVVSGWDDTQLDNRSSSPDILHQVEVFLIHHNDRICNESLNDERGQFCAALYEGGKDTCQGDSGGPIFQWIGDRWEQVGIASFGIGCSLEGLPGVYTRLAYYSDWIRSVISEPITTTTTTGTKPPIIYRCDRTATCGCGLTDVALSPSRIVGGSNAVVDNWSMIVSLQVYGDHGCGGTLLSNSFVLTAAHCVKRIVTEGNKDLIIATGMTNLSDPRQITRKIDQIYIHPNFIGSSDGYRHDIALLHVESPIIYDNNARWVKSCIHRIEPPTLTNQHPRKVNAYADRLPTM
ncbi:unnamed protein product [Didymodactylos carnosus]|uniref:Peptidase S1 domain-containing protein n=1 Tax=Didymodactylos carnosus TaxID=1234261 RepID=A0A815FM75_9BILA|nr:unnamed protein product [Didymodactylos carnosus]CAF4166341.1 unnamed protein product [Didymodactylos carnosus]